MCSEDIQQQILVCLQQIENSLNSDEYEFSDPLTIGGATGMYGVSSPYNSECEWALLSALGVGTLGSTAIYTIGSHNPGIRVVVNGDTFGTQTTGGRDTGNALNAYVGALTLQAPFVTYEANFAALPSPATLYLVTSTPATTAIFITLMFRRKLTRFIPDKPRQKPHSHTVVSRAPIRRLPAESTQVAGYESQYPEQGGPPYKHVLIPSGDQDTGVAKRGIFPLGGSNGSRRR